MAENDFMSLAVLRMQMQAQKRAENLGKELSQA
jgi:hypothetical protein